MAKLRINYPLLSTLVYNNTDPNILGIKDNWFCHYSHYLNTTVIYQRHQPCISNSFHHNPSHNAWSDPEYQESKMMIGAL